MTPAALLDGVTSVDQRRVAKTLDLACFGYMSSVMEKVSELWKQLSACRRLWMRRPRQMQTA